MGGASATTGEGGDRVHVVRLDSGPAVDVVERGGEANAPVWPGMGARERSVLRLRLAADGATRLLHHPADAVFYVQSGDGAVDDGAGEARPLVEGSMVHVDAGTDYRFSAGPSGMTVLGGPCPPDPALFASLAGER